MKESHFNLKLTYFGYYNWEVVFLQWAFFCLLWKQGLNDLSSWLTSVLLYMWAPWPYVQGLNDLSSWLTSVLLYILASWIHVQVHRKLLEITSWIFLFLTRWTHKLRTPACSFMCTSHISFIPCELCNNRHKYNFRMLYESSGIQGAVKSQSHAHFQNEIFSRVIIQFVYL